MRCSYWSAAWLVWLAGCQSAPAVHPQYRPLVEAVYASGKVLPADDHQVYAQADGLITRQHVREGDTVRAGQAMFTIEGSSQNARLSGAEEVLRQAERNAGKDSPVLAELRAQLASLRSRLTDDSTNYVRYQNLWRQNATTRVTLDRAALAYRTSRNDLLAARARFRRTQFQVQVDLTNARSTARVSATDAGNTVTRADAAGTVFNVFRKQGETIRRGEPLASLGRQGAFYLQLFLDESDVARVKVGQAAVVKLDLFPDQTFRARLTTIYPSLNAENQSVRADAEFEETPKGLIANAFVEANVVVLRRPHALTVPKVLVENDSVLVKGADGKPHRIRIQTGIKTTDFVEVVGGLTEQAELVQP
jgi:HlyD family secretion protein